jgi:predicted dehydrogenase
MADLKRRDLLALSAANLAAQTPLAGDRPAKSMDVVRFGIIGAGTRGIGLMRNALAVRNTAVTAVCDLAQERVSQAIDVVATMRGVKPAGYSNGPKDYRNLLGRGDVDAVLIVTGNEDHAYMAVDALRAGKHVLSEVPAATTIEECRQLVRTAEETGCRYMLAENYTYFRTNKAVLNMVGKGLLGETTYAECGYIHDTRPLQFTKDGKPNWRSERAKLPGNRYPTHGVGTVAQWFGINRGDRFVSLVSMASPAKALNHHLRARFGPESPQATTQFAADTVVTLLKTAQGRLVELRNDHYSPKPHPGISYHNLLGTKGTYKDEEAEQRIWLEGRSPKYEWEPFSKYAKEFDHPLWAKWADEALKTRHRGGDYIQLTDFVQALRSGSPTTIDVYDAAAWCAIIELSANSVTQGGKPQEFPDFTRGQWPHRKPL